MKRKWLISGLALVALAGVGIGVGLSTGALKLPAGDAWAKADAVARPGKDGKKPDPPLEFMPREVTQPRLARLPGSVEFSGPLVAPQTAIVRAKASGTLLTLAVAEGSRVHAGQVLGRIELADLNSRIAERAANLESTRAALLQAERTHASNEGLAAQKFISPIALDNSRAALDAARANVAAAQAALETASVGLREAALAAPIAGIVAKRHVLPGEKVSVEQQVLTIVDLSQLELAGSVGTHEVARIAPGMAVAVQVEGVDQAVAGRIARIAPAAEPGTRAIGVTIALANPKEMLRAGQYALARATLADDTDRLTLPLAAIARSSGQDHVWLIEKGVLARRAVTLGRRNEREGLAEVLQGVTPASQVLAARFENLREGAQALVVVVKPAPVASAAASGTALVR